jgi:hypothetical protein
MSVYIDFNKDPVEYSVHYCRGGRTTEDVQSVIKDKHADGWLILVFGPPKYEVLEQFFERWPDDEGWYGHRYKYWPTKVAYDTWIKEQ